MRRIRGAIGMGLTWAVGWAIMGIGIGVASLALPFLPWHLVFEIFDAPLPAMAVPGFFGGIFYSIVLGIAGRRRRFDELSLPRVATWGAIGGLMLALFPGFLVLVGLAHLGGSPSGWSLAQLTALIAAPFMLAGAGSATGSLLVARKAERQALSAGGDLADVGLSDSEKRELLGGGS
ncbi:MAG: hypothetical protein Q8K55_16235 [Gemmatimonadaceae bacterium]|nr:hypothetical protein [Gemmatimonadaceae bacterium]